MLKKYFGGKIPVQGTAAAKDEELKKAAAELPAKLESLMDQLQFSNALAEIWKFIARANKYIDETMPWALAKKQEEERLRTVMYNLLESIRIISVLLLPFMPQTPARIWRQLGMAEQPEIQTWDSILSFGQLPANLQTVPGEVLFPRLELTGEGGAPVRQATKKDKPAQGKKNPAAGEKAVTEEGLISIDEFARLDLRVAEITARSISGADKLLKLQVDVGGRVRLCIAKHYRRRNWWGKELSL